MDASSLLIRPSDPEPIYRQIVAQVRRLVAGGQLEPGTLLPSVREVAATHAVNPMTVSRAYGLLESEGVLERLRGRGMAVAARTRRATSEHERLALLTPQLEAVARQARELELSTDAVVQRLDALLRDET